MHGLRIFVFCILAALLLQGTLLPAVRAGEEEEGFAEVLDEAGLDGDLQANVAELFSHVQALENSFRNLRWAEAAAAVDNVDLFYNKLLALARDRGVDIDLATLQAFEFSLAEISRGIQRRNRALVEKRFLELQPELFDILDRLTTTPLRLTACRLYVDLAARGVRSDRFDIARDELGEITEFMEQLRPQLASRGYDMDEFDQRLVLARQQVLARNPDVLQALAGLRRLLDHYHRTYAIRASKDR